MTQVTAKTLLEALLWIHTHQHHEVGTEYSMDGRSATHTFFKNYHSKLRVPNSSKCDWVDEFHRLIRPNPRPHDDRMFALKPKAKRMVLASLTHMSQADWSKFRKAHP